MRVTVLHTRLSGYFTACLEALKDKANPELQLFVRPRDPNAPFDEEQFVGLGGLYNRTEHNAKEIFSLVRSFNPDVILASGWADAGYLEVCRRMRSYDVPVVAGCDTQWKGSIRQIIASKTARWHVKRALDVLWVTGERQAMLARALGFDGDSLWDGYYACDWDQFAMDPKSLPVIRSEENSIGFIYVGRYAPEKGIDTLVEAYQLYRDMVDDPWPLFSVGAGQLAKTLEAVGASNLGFIQPKRLPSVLHRAGAFVLPSRTEPWGVVVHEAAAAGLPLILSSAVGAGVHLLRPGLNGYSFRPGDAYSLSKCMFDMHQASVTRRNRMSQVSYILSKQYTPNRWAETLITGLSSLRRSSVPRIGS